MACYIAAILASFQSPYTIMVSDFNTDLSILHTSATLKTQTERLSIRSPEEHGKKAPTNMLCLLLKDIWLWLVNFLLGPTPQKEITRNSLTLWHQRMTTVNTQKLNDHYSYWALTCKTMGESFKSQSFIECTWQWIPATKV